MQLRIVRLIGMKNTVKSILYMRVNMIGKPLGTPGVNRTPGLVIGAVVEGGIVGAGEAGGNYIQKKY